MAGPRSLLDAYGVELPDSFTAFADLSLELSRRDVPIQGDPLGIRLGRAFDALDPAAELGSFDPLRESRYVADPPEFLTVLHGPTDGLHWGYFVDDPGDPGFIVAVTYGADSPELAPAGRCLFEALRSHLELAHQDAVDGAAADPDHRELYRRRLDTLATTRRSLMAHATGSRLEQGGAYTARYVVGRSPSAPTLDGIGVLVPDGTYRAVAEPAIDARSGRAATAELAAYLDRGRRALAEGFPGTALKVGRDLWPFPNHLDASADLLEAAYLALGRPRLVDWLGAARDVRRRLARSP